MITSKNKIEERAVDEVSRFINCHQTLSADIRRGDKGISWDGAILLYQNGNTDKKENYRGSIPIQVKGRSSRKQSERTKFALSFAKADLENYLRSDGALLMGATFDERAENPRLFYQFLLPASLTQILEEMSRSGCSSHKIKFQPIEKSKDFEQDCHNFFIQSTEQKRMQPNFLKSFDLKLNTGATSLNIPVAIKPGEDILKRLLEGDDQFVYAKDACGAIIGLAPAVFDEISIQTGLEARTLDGSVAYNCTITHSKSGERRIIFPAGEFVMKDKGCVLNFAIGSGSIRERIKNADFINQIVRDGALKLGDKECGLKVDRDAQLMAESGYARYHKLETYLAKLDLPVEILAKAWSDEDVYKLYKFLAALAEGDEVKLDTDKKSLIGRMRINGLCLTAAVERQKSGKYKLLPLWGDQAVQGTASVSLEDGRKLTTNLLFLGYDPTVLAANNADYGWMRQRLEKAQLDAEKCEMTNLHLLSVLSAYDETRRPEILAYAEFVAELLYRHDPSSGIYYLNWLQVQKRLGKKLSEEDIRTLMETRDREESLLAKAACAILLESPREARAWIDKMDEREQAVFRSHPIMNLLML